MDLSYPVGLSVNNGILCDKYLGEDYKLQLPNTLILRNRIRDQGQGCYLWSRDLQNYVLALSTIPYWGLIVGYYMYVQNAYGIYGRGPWKEKGSQILTQPRPRKQ